MNTVNNSVLRSVLGIILGVFLIVWPEVAVTYLVVLIGIFFIIPGLYSLIVYLFRKKETDLSSRLFPVIAVGSILLGVWLVAMPGFFVGAFMYLLGALLVLAGIQQLYALIRARKWYRVPFVYHIIPLVILLTGVLILVYPSGVAKNTVIVFGIAGVLYGINELVNRIKFGRRIREDIYTETGEEEEDDLVNFP